MGSAGHSGIDSFVFRGVSYVSPFIDLKIAGFLLFCFNKTSDKESNFSDLGLL